MMTFDEANKNVSGAIDELQSSTNWNGMNTTNKQEIAYCLAVISNQFHELREIYAKPVEMTQEQKDVFMAGKSAGNSFYETIYEIECECSGISQMVWAEKKIIYSYLSEDNLMRAWFNPKEVIKVVE